MRIDDAGKVAFIESILSAEEIHYLIADVDAESSFSAGFPARVLVHTDEFDRALELLISAGFEHEIYPMKKPADPNDN